jgi:hypothetical protein
VTPELALVLANKYLHPNKSVIGIVGKREEVGESLERFGDVTIYDEKLETQN